MCIKNSNKNQLKRNKIDQFIAVSIWGVEWWEDNVDWREDITQVPYVFMDIGDIITRLLHFEYDQLTIYDEYIFKV